MLSGRWRCTVDTPPHPHRRVLACPRAGVSKATVAGLHAESRQAAKEDTELQHVQSLRVTQVAVPADLQAPVPGFSGSSAGIAANGHAVAAYGHSMPGGIGLADSHNGVELHLDGRLACAAASSAQFRREGGMHGQTSSTAAGVDIDDDHSSSGSSSSTSSHSHTMAAQSSAMQLEGNAAHQQILERLQSHGAASTSNGSNGSHSSRGSKSNSRPSSHSSSSSSSCAPRLAVSPSSAKAAQPRVVKPSGAVWNAVGPGAAPHRPTVKGGVLTPQRLTALSDVLCMAPQHVQRLLDKCPALLTDADPTALRPRIADLAAALGLQYAQAAYMWTKQPQYFLATQPQAVAVRVQELASALRLSEQDVVYWAAATPAVLKRTTASLEDRLERICGWTGLGRAAAAAAAASTPELLTANAARIDKRIASLRAALLVQSVSVQRLLALQPDVLFVSPRILMNKLRVLMAIVDKDRHAVGLLVISCPGLLRADLDAVRASHGALTAALAPRSPGFVFAALCHNSRLLLEPPARLAAKGTRLRACISRCGRWRAEWDAFRPPAAEEALARRAGVLERLEYLLVTHQAEGAGLLEVLLARSAVFAARFPEYVVWHEGRRRARLARAAAQADGAAAMMPQQQQPHQQQQRQQKHKQQAQQQQQRPSQQEQVQREQQQQQPQQRKQSQSAEKQSWVRARQAWAEKQQRQQQEAWAVRRQELAERRQQRRAYKQQQGHQQGQQQGQQQQQQEQELPQQPEQHAVHAQQQQQQQPNHQQQQHTGGVGQQPQHLAFGKYGQAQPAHTAGTRPSSNGDVAQERPLGSTRRLVVERSRHQHSNGHSNGFAGHGLLPGLQQHQQERGVLVHASSNRLSQQPPASMHQR